MQRLNKMDRSFRSNLITYGMVVVAYLLVELAMGAGLISNSLQGQLVPICTYVVLAISLNLTVGVSGELSLGHAGFMSVGAFFGSVLWLGLSGSVPGWLGLIICMLVGGVMAGVFGLLIGIPVLRLQGDYLAIVTLAFGEIIKNIFNAIYLGVDSSGLHFSMKDATSMGLAEDGKVLINGAIGITGITKVSSFTAGVLLVLVTLFVVLNLINSRAGRAIMAIRDNRIAAEATGLNVTKYKLMAFITSAVFAGMAGVLYALNMSTVVAKKFDYNMSILVLVFVVLGGMGNIRGSIIAAAVLTVLPELLRSVADYRMLVYAVLLILMMIFTQSPQMAGLRQRLLAPLHRGSRGQSAQQGEV